MTALEWAQHLMALANGRPEKLAVAKDETMDVNRGIVLHRETSVTGMVAKVYMPGEYKSPLNDRPVTSHVVELDGGHTFWFNGDAPAEAFQAQFHLLSIREAHYLLMMIGALDKFVGGFAHLGAAMKLDMATGRVLMLAVLERATRALKTPVKAEPTPSGAA